MLILKTFAQSRENSLTAYLINFVPHPIPNKELDLCKASTSSKYH